MDPNVRTDFLFPKTNFAVGLGSIVSVHGSYFEYNYSETNEDVDTRAIASDWQMVGKDIQEATILCSGDIVNKANQILMER